MNLIKSTKDYDFGKLAITIIFGLITIFIMIIINYPPLGLLELIIAYIILRLLIKPKTIIEKFNIILVCFLTIIIVYMIYVIITTELALKDYVGVISLLFTLLIFNLNNISNLLKKTEKQLQNLEILSIELDDMLETVNWIKNIIETETPKKVAMLIPAHNIKDFNINYYLTNLDSKIKNLETTSIKKLLLKINDKVRMINKPIEIYLNKIIETGKINENAAKYAKINIFNAIDDIKEKIPDVKKIIDNILLN